MNSTVRKAVVLAAGLGTRLRPLTCSTPKPLLPVWGEPMLARIVASLRSLGVEDIVVNCHYLHEQVEAWCAANGCRAIHEPEILGTGGVLNPLRDWIGGESFYLVNGDIVVENAPALAPELERAPDDVVGVCLAVETGPRTVEVEPESGYVTNWKSEDAGYPGTFTYCGFALLRPRILDYVEREGFSSIVQAYERAMADGLFVRAVRSDSLLWTDAGEVSRYLELNRSETDNAYAELPQVRAALSAVGGSDVTFIGARGSDRVFFGCDRGVIVVYDDAKRTENALYAGHARFLKAHGASVPDVLADLPELKTLVLENAGVERAATFEESVRVIEALADFHEVDPSGLELMPPLDGAAWEWERGLFAEHCLGARYLRAMPAAVESELRGVAARLEAEPSVLVHRDFQSTNVLWKNGRPRFIDFQGMRRGPAAYDLASYLYDPYVKPLADDRRRALVAAYAHRRALGDLGEIVTLAAVERLVQCLGAFGRLASVGQPQFGRFVPQALENLLAAADDAGLDAVGALVEDLIAEEEKRSHGASPQGSCRCGHDHGS